jgi:hypothetical protein
MTDTPNDGGPAFPCQEEASTSFSGCPVTIQHSGMTLRDYFAAASLTSLIEGIKPHRTPENVAYWAYKYADAMVAERNKTND